jgi:hypothetical protein
MKMKFLFPHIKLKDAERFLIPVVVAVILKIFMFSWIQWSINQRPDLFSYNFWWETFTIWDGGWYNLIARYWYEAIPISPPISAEQTFAFSPAFPALIRVLGFLIGNFAASQVIIASIFGVLWIPLFQLVAEHYLSQEEAFSATLIAALFPTVFLFSSVGYSEGLFLTLTLSSWFLYLKEKHLFASVAVAGTSLTRPFGIILIVPMFLECVIRKQFRDALLYISAGLAQVAWFCYGWLKTGNFLAVLEAQKYWSNRKFLTQYVMPTLFQTSSPFSFNLPCNEAFVGFVFCLLAIFILLIAKVSKLDWKLAVYSVLAFFVAVLFGNIQSYPRYLSFIFPVWLTLRAEKNRWLILILFMLGFSDLFFAYLFARWAFLG